MSRQVRVFEIDHPDTQAWKRQRLDSAGIVAGENVSLVAVDFEKYAGQRVRIQTVPGPEGSTTLRGKLRGLEGGKVLLDEDDGQRLELPRSSIAEARLEVEI